MGESVAAVVGTAIAVVTVNAGEDSATSAGGMTGAGVGAGGVAGTVSGGGAGVSGTFPDPEVVTDGGADDSGVSGTFPDPEVVTDGGADDSGVSGTFPDPEVVKDGGADDSFRVLLSPTAGVVAATLEMLLAVLVAAALPSLETPSLEPPRLVVVVVLFFSAEPHFDTGLDAAPLVAAVLLVSAPAPPIRLPAETVPHFFGATTASAPTLPDAFPSLDPLVAERAATGSDATALALFVDDSNVGTAAPPPSAAAKVAAAAAAAAAFCAGDCHFGADPAAAPLPNDFTPPPNFGGVEDEEAAPALLKLLTPAPKGFGRGSSTGCAVLCCSDGFSSVPAAAPMEGVFAAAGTLASAGAAVVDAASEAVALPPRGLLSTAFEDLRTPPHLLVTTALPPLEVGRAAATDKEPHFFGATTADAASDEGTTDEDDTAV